MSRNSHPLFHVSRSVPGIIRALSGVSRSKFHVSKRRSAFALMELLVYIVVLTGVTAAVGGIFVSMDKGGKKAQAQAEVNSALRFAMNKIGQDLKSASAVSSPSSPGAPSNSLALTASGSGVAYDVSSGIIRRQAGNNPAENLTSGKVVFSTPVFTRYENTNSVLGKTTVSVKVSLTATYNSGDPGLQYSQTKTETFNLR